jgi:1-acyl-sn-glycerol-3-phosphate acyltransferase
VVWRPVVEGRENVPTDGPLILASNHLSFIDSIVIPLVVNNRRVVFLAKREYFTDRSLRALPARLFFQAMGALPLERDEQAGAQAALDTALDVLREDLAIGIYPEGTRSRDGRLYRGRTGIAWLAFAANAPVVPVALTGTDKVQPVGSRMLRVHQVTVRIAPPIRPEDYDATKPGRARRQLTDDVMDAIAAHSEQDRADGYNERTSD